MRLVALPGVGVAEARFGMRSAEIIAAIAGESRKFRRGEGALQDYFPKLGLFVGYDTAGMAKFFELTRASGALLDGFDLFSKRLSEVLKHFEASNVFVETTVTGLLVREWGLALWYPRKDERNPHFESMYLTDDAALLPAVAG